MDAKYNINIVMCESSDEEVTHIKNIFNKINLGSEGRASFDVVTFVNCFGEPSDFSLAYFLQHKIREDGGPRLCADRSGA